MDVMPLFSHIALCPLTDGNFAAIVRTVESQGGGIIHRILSHSGSNKAGKGTGLAARRRKEINGAEKYCIINNYEVGESLPSTYIAFY